MKFLYSSILFVVLNGAVMADDALFLNVPQSVQAGKGRIKELKVDTNAKEVVWFLENSDADLVVVNGGKRAIFCSTTEGVYTVLVVVAKGDTPKIAKIEIVVGNGPNPKPPVPPDPPVPPTPNDPLYSVLEAAYKADTGADKKDKKETLAKIYKSGIDTVNDKSVDTVLKLYTVLAKAGNSLLGDSSLLGVRREIAKELDKVLPIDTSTKLDDNNREQFRLQFKRISDILNKIP